MAGALAVRTTLTVFTVFLGGCRMVGDVAGRLEFDTKRRFADLSEGALSELAFMLSTVEEGNRPGMLAQMLTAYYMTMLLQNLMPGHDVELVPSDQCAQLDVLIIIKKKVDF